MRKTCLMTLALGGVLAAQGQGGQRGKLSQFMRPKLDHSKKVLEGLTLEDFDMVAQGAREMKALSEAAEGKVSPNVPYIRDSGEFQNLADELAENAKEKDIDGATLAYVQLTINRVKCHKFCRDNRIISALPEVPGRLRIAGGK